jgi:hypothetical protein
VLTGEVMGQVLSCERNFKFEVLMLLSEAEDRIWLYVFGEYSLDLAQSETLSTWRSPLRGTWEVSSLSCYQQDRLMKEESVR